ncbi:hypothetical protein AB0H45_29070 [Streptomyces atroolivaceus]|uniref:hypothetical protein n=1 Tax=Streptomyces atroolivaceus TaxID=66869 RepID=UPI0034069E96
MLHFLAISITDALTCVNADTSLARQGSEAVGPRVTKAWNRRAVTARCGVECAADLLDVAVADGWVSQAPGRG